MTLVFLDQAWEDYLYWQSADKTILKKINFFIKEIDRTPFEGSGKPEPLKHKLAGLWSRRLNLEHRIIYKIENGAIVIYQCRYHS
jgi:toxin YoeB